MGTTKRRLEKLERRNPKKEPRVIRVMFEGQEPLTADEEAILTAEEDRRMKAAAGPGAIIVMHWTSEEAQRLGATA